MICDKCHVHMKEDWWLLQSKQVRSSAAAISTLCPSCHDLLLKFLKEKVPAGVAA